MWKNRYVSTTIVSLFIALMALAALAPAAQAQLRETKIVASDGVDGDLFGQAVAISGSTAVVGVSGADLGNDENAGAAYVFERIDGQWREVQKLIASNGEEGHFFGDRVAIDGDMILVGAPGNDDQGGPSSGAVYTFERIDGVWQEVQKIYPDDPSTFKSFGEDIALDGDRAFIGAIQDSQVNTFSGAAYAFERQNDEWVQDDKLLPPLGVGGDVLASFFGLDIGLDGDRVIISASTEDDAAPFAGTASVFERINGQWQLFDKLLPPPVEEPDSLDNDLFGLDVALSGDWALVSSHDDERCINNTTLPRPNFCNAGAVFAYQRQDNDHWELQQKIAPEELGDRDFFGQSIAIEGSRAVVGAPADDDACPDPPPPTPLFCNPGAVYLFELIDDEWQQVDKFTASDADSTDVLGLAVAISGSHVIAGAPRSTFDSNPKPDLGAAYLFKIFNRDPVAQDDQATTSQNTPVEIDVLANDSDPDFDALSLSIASQPPNGSVTVNNGGKVAATTITYTPTGFSGTDTFTYEIDDDDGTDQATVSINVTSGNASPVVTQALDDIALILGGDAFTSDLTTVFSDPDGDALSFSASSSDAAVATATVSGQTLTVEAVALGSATITAMADDGNGGTASTSFTVNVPTGVAVEDGDTGLPTTFALAPNYPNPFNPETRIRFGLPASEVVRLAVFDVLGREVAVLVETRLPAGRHAAVFEASELPSGVYVYQLQTAQQTLSRAMLLLK